jgi:hypothetical protein
MSSISLRKEATSKMKPIEKDLSDRINELGDKATQLLTFLSFAIVAVVLLETAQAPVLAPYQTGAIKWAMRFWAMALFPILINVFPVKDFKWGNARWYDSARREKFGLLWLSVLLILAGVVEFLCAIW